jgi:uncharacterized protein
VIRRLQALGSRLQLITELPSAILLFVLHLYKRLISPFFLPACRYVPTCSEYAAEAIERNGAIRGSLMAAWRLLRCHPFVKGGFDPVPNVVPPTVRRTARDPGHAAPCNH